MSINIGKSVSGKKDLVGLESHFDKENEQNTINSCSQKESRHLNIQNYVEIRSRTIVQCLSYLNLISEAFYFDKNSIQTEILQLDKQIDRETVEKNKNHGIQVLQKFNTNTPIFKSFTNYTRKSHEQVFFLIDRQNKCHDLSQHYTHYKIRILFINYQGRLLHVLSNLQPHSISKLAKVINKHFTKLQSFTIIDFNTNLQQGQKILNLIKELNKKCILISPLACTMFAQLKKTSNQSFSSLDCLNLGGRAFDNLILSAIVFNNGSSQRQDLEPTIWRGLQMWEIYEYIMNNFLKSEVVSSGMHFKNQFINSIMGLYFNLFTDVGFVWINQVDWISVKQQMDNKIGKLFLSSMLKFNLVNQKIQIYRNQQKLKCFPHLFQSSKKCIVCKQSKPKYGCYNCTIKFKEQIHLCIGTCFKQFHLSKIKYISNIISSSNFQGLQLNQQPKNIDKASLLKTPQIQFLPSIATSPQPNNDGNIDYLKKFKRIKKKVNKISQSYKVSFLKVKGSKNFFLIPTQMLFEEDNHQQNQYEDTNNS